MKDKKEFLEKQLRYVQASSIAMLYNAQTISIHTHQITEKEIEEGINKIIKYVEERIDKLKDLNTDDEFLKFCKEVDNSSYSSTLEHQFCIKYGLEYTGKLDLSAKLSHTCGLCSSYRSVDSLVYDEMNKSLIINGKSRSDVNGITFIDKKFILENSQDFRNAVKHYKRLKEKIKLQNAEQDFDD